MDGKYMKTKRILIPTMTMIIISSLLFGCAATSPQESFDMLQQTDQIELEYAVPDYDITEDSAVELLPWLALGELESHPELRQAFDAYFGITGTVGNKEGSLYYNTDTQKADQNVTLFMVLKNQSTRNAFISLAPMEAFGAMAAEHYADVEADDLASAYATINAYFELLPDQEAGHFDGDCTISRAQAMTLLMRATTTVSESGKPAVNKDFTTAVGESEYTDFAAPMDEFAYLNTEKGLNIGAFNTAMSKGEYICMVTNLIKADYLAEIESQGFEDIYADKDVTISVVTDAGNITFADAISDASKGVPTDMCKTFETAVKYGFLTEDALEDWDASITKSEAVELFVSMVANYSSNIGNVLYTGSDNVVTQDEGVLVEEKSLDEFIVTLPGDKSPIENYQDWVRSQGADYASGWVFIYKHGESAGNQPTYGIYMNENSNRYLERFEVGDYLPDGSQLTGTMEEFMAWQAQDLKDTIMEDGEEGEDYRIEDDGDFVIIID